MAISSAASNSGIGITLSGDSGNATTPHETTIAVVEEQLDVQIRKDVTGVVRIEKVVNNYDAIVSEELISDSVSVERVAINRTLDEPAVSRQEGDVTIIPVMEEVVVVSKQLILKEEIRITRKKELFRHEERVPLRSEEVKIERLEPPA